MPTNEQLRSALTAIQTLGVDPFSLLAYAMLLDAHDEAIQVHEDEPSEPLMTDAESLEISFDVENDDPSIGFQLVQDALQFAALGYTA